MRGVGDDRTSPAPSKEDYLRAREVRLWGVSTGEDCLEAEDRDRPARLRRRYSAMRERLDTLGVSPGGSRDLQLMWLVLRRLRPQPLNRVPAQLQKALSLASIEVCYCPLEPDPSPEGDVNSWADAS